MQCAPEWYGGITELQKICTIASVFDVGIIPHGHSLHAALCLIASAAGFGIEVDDANVEARTQLHWP